MRIESSLERLREGFFGVFPVDLGSGSAAMGGCSSYPSTFIMCEQDKVYLFSR